MEPPFALEFQVKGADLQWWPEVGIWTGSPPALTVLSAYQSWKTTRLISPRVSYLFLLEY